MILNTEPMLHEIAYTLENVPLLQEVLGKNFHTHQPFLMQFDEKVGGFRSRQQNCAECARVQRTTLTTKQCLCKAEVPICEWHFQMHIASASGKTYLLQQSTEG